MPCETKTDKQEGAYILPPPVSLPASLRLRVAGALTLTFTLNSDRNPYLPKSNQRICCFRGGSAVRWTCD